MMSNMVNREKIWQLFFKKKGLIKYTSHRDLITSFYIGIVRAALPVIYTEGFSKKPKVVFGPALALGVASECEIANVYIKSEAEFDEKEILNKLNSSMTSGYEFYGVKEFAVLKDADSAIEKIKAFSYRYELSFTENDNIKQPADFDPAGLLAFIKANIGGFMAAGEFMADHNAKLKNIRPYVNKLEIKETKISERGLELALDVEMLTMNNSSIKPHLLFQALLGADFKKLIYDYNILKTANIY
ncbi:MAG: TIGR03936 family radical SAM-associated protein [Candidatus Wallbacteria bacterium]